MVVVDKVEYVFIVDLENILDLVFCVYGVGYLVVWN